MDFNTSSGLLSQEQLEEIRLAGKPKFKTVKYEKEYSLFFGLYKKMGIAQKTSTRWCV